jgi:putative hydrolase of the HAD superfamily
MMTDIKAVLFDLDDTLFDRRKAQNELLHVILKELPLLFHERYEEVVLSAFLESDIAATQEFNAGISVAISRNHRFQIFLEILGLNTNWSKSIEEAYLKSYPLINTFVTGAEAVVERLARHFQVGIISNGSPDVQHHKLDNLGITDLLNCIILSEEVGIKKPDTAIFYTAANTLNKRPDECLYIGDSYQNDVMGARQAGMKTCWVNPEYLVLSSSDIKPDIQISSLDEIFTHLDYKWSVSA